MAASEDFNNKVLLFNNDEPTNPIESPFEKILSQKRHLF